MDFSSYPQQKIKVQVSDRDALCKALAAEMSRSDAVNYIVEYTVRGDPDAASTPEVKKQQAKDISMTIVKRVVLKCPTYQWIRKTVSTTKHTIRNGFICALSDRVSSGNIKTESCNGSLAITVIRRIDGEYTIRALLDHDFEHATYSVTPASAQPMPTQAPMVPKKPLKQSILTGSTRFEVPLPYTDVPIAKDILRALGRRARTPERVYPALGKPLGSIKENELPSNDPAPVKRGRGRPKKEVDPNAPVDFVKPIRPRGRPRKNPAPALMENRTLSNHAITTV